MKLPTAKNVVATFSYILMIFVLNAAYTYLPGIYVWGSELSAGDMLVGAVYIVRDFAQREIKHYVLLAMVIGAGLSYLLADKTIALASICAFATGEIIDWAIFTFTRKPLSQRLLLSSIVSAPVDSWVFLYVANRVGLLEFSVITLAKFIGVAILWFGWRYKYTASLKIN